MGQVNAVTGMPLYRKGQTAALNARLNYLPQILAQQSQAKFQTAQLEDMAASQELAKKKFGIEEGQYGLAQQQYGLQERGVGLQEQEFGLKQKEQGLNEQRFGLEQQGLEQQKTQFGYQQQQAKAAQSLQEDTQAREMGIKAAGLGFTTMSGGTGSGLTFGDIGNKASGMWSNLFSPKDTAPSMNFNSETGKYEGSVGNISPMKQMEQPGVLSSFPIGATLGGGLIGAGVGKAFGGQNKLKSSLIGFGAGGLAGLLGGQGNWMAGLGGGLLGGLGGLI